MTQKKTKKDWRLKMVKNTKVNKGLALEMQDNFGMRIMKNYDNIYVHELKINREYQRALDPARLRSVKEGIA